MNVIDILYKLVAPITLLAMAIAGYTRLLTKLKEMEMRIIALENQQSKVEAQDDKIMDKLDSLFDMLTQIKIDLQNKQDREP